MLNEKVVWRAKKGGLVQLLLSYVQVAYHGGHISFVGGKRVFWVYDITELTHHEAQLRSRSASFVKFLTIARLVCAWLTKRDGCCSTIAGFAN